MNVCPILLLNTGKIVVLPDMKFHVENVSSNRRTRSTEKQYGNV